MTRHHLIAAFLPLFLLISSATGQKSDPPAEQATEAAPATDSEGGSVFIPGTPVGERFAWLLRLMNEDVVVAWKANFSLGFTRRLQRDTFMSNVRQLRERSGGWDLVEIRTAEFEEITSILRMRRNDSLWQFEVRIEPFEPYKITGIRLLPVATAPYTPLESWDAITAALEELDGESSLTVYEVNPGGSARRLYDHNGDAQLSIGAVSGVYLTTCLAEAIAHQETTWQMPIMVIDELRSLPPGEVSEAPDGSVMPLARMVQSLFATGDHSAFDHLLQHIGREHVEEWIRQHHPDPERTIPFLSSREVAVLKYAADDTLLRAYAEGDAAARRHLVDNDLNGMSLSGVKARVWRTPREIDTVGWFASTNATCLTLAHLMAHMLPTQLSLLDAAPSLPLDRFTWSRVIFKAGAEPGVLSVAMLLTRNDERHFAIAFTTNNTEANINGNATHPIVMSTMELLGRRR